MAARAKSTPRVLLVTGGSRGIGAAISRAAGREGYAVAVNFVQDSDAAHAVVADIQASGATAFAVQGDVGVEADVVAMFEAVDARLGRITHLVNNAGQSSDFQVLDATLALLHKSFALNFFGAVLCVREALSRMSNEHGGPGGVIVNVSSRAAVLGGLPGRTVYAAAKGALDSFSIGLAREAGPLGVRVNAIRPGATATESQVRRTGIDTLLRHTASTALARPAQPEEIASVVMFLLSDASGYLAGSIVDASGGL